MSGKGLKQIEKKKPPKISFDAMKFGRERDLKIALTELKWTKRNKGKLIKTDFETVSEKYKFPVDFLKEALKGFSYPEDYMVSKSKWFPIIYSWRDHERELGLNLFKFQIDYVQTLFRCSIFLAVLGSILFQLGFTIQNLLDLDWLRLLSVIILPFTFFFISLCVGLRSNITNKKMKLDEYSAKLKEEGFHGIIAANEKFIREHYRMIALAGGVFLKNIQQSPPVDFFYIGMKEVEKPVRLSGIGRLLTKLHLLPRQSASIEKEKIPVFYGENPYIEYRKRIEELAEDQTIA